MQFDDPIGKRLSIWGNEGNIVGVVKDYHMSTFHSAIPPMIIFYDPENVNVALVKVAGDYSKALSAIEDVALKYNPSESLDYVFLDDAQAQMYESEITLGKLSAIFVFLAIFIKISSSCFYLE